MRVRSIVKSEIFGVDESLIPQLLSGCSIGLDEKTWDQLTAFKKRVETNIMKGTWLARPKLVWSKRGLSLPQALCDITGNAVSKVVGVKLTVYKENA